MAALPWFAFDREAYISNTMHLTTEEHGAYLLLMLTYYGTGKPLPGYERALASIAKLPLERWYIVAVALKPFFIEDTTEQGSIWRHERIETELLAASSKHAAAVAKATAAAQARHGKSSSAPAKSVLQAVVERTPSRKRAPSQAKASSEHTPSTPQASSSSPHLHLHTTTTDVVVVAREGAKHDDDNSKAIEVSKEETFNPLGAVLSKDWVPSEHGISTARQHGMTDQIIEDELVRFHDTNEQRGGFSKDWDATWRLWCAEWKKREAAKPKLPMPRVEVDNKPSAENWDRACALWAKGGSSWAYKSLGPDPSQSGCRCPNIFLTKHKIDPATGRVAAPSKEPVS